MSDPVLPFEIVRRIIHWRLALTPSYPCSLRSDDPISPSWDSQAGQSGRQASSKRGKERVEAQKAALDLMFVCKSWKSVVMKYLYTEPAIQASNLLSLTASVVNGDKKWSDINLHPHSLPGRYITTLDLSNLDEGYPSLHITTIHSALKALIPLLPNLRHLVLPTRSPLTCEDIGLAPFAKHLRCLRGLSVYSFSSLTGGRVRGAGKDPYVWLLGQLSSLEVLSIHGPGNTEVDLLANVDEDDLDVPSNDVQLDKLHTLTLDGIKSGPLLRTLTHSDLPSLRRLIMTSYHNILGDETYTFQSTHGPKILSLTYTHSNEWPTSEATPPIETLELHPKLLHLSFVFPHSVLQSNLEIAQGLTGAQYGSHPLRAITLPKWNENTRNQSPSPSPSPAMTPLTQTTHFANNHSNTNGYLSIPINTSRTPNRFLSTILKSPPSQLKVMTIDGFRWVRPDLGRRALEAGNSGTMRNWAVEMETRGIEMRDMDGKVLPPPQDLGAPRFGESISLGMGRGRRGDKRVFYPAGAAAAAGRSRDRGHEDGS